MCHLIHEKWARDLPSRATTLFLKNYVNIWLNCFPNYVMLTDIIADWIMFKGNVFWSGWKALLWLQSLGFTSRLPSMVTFRAAHRWRQGLAPGPTCRPPDLLSLTCIKNKCSWWHNLKGYDLIHITLITLSSLFIQRQLNRSFISSYFK